MIMHQAAATMTGNAAIIALSIKKKKEVVMTKLIGIGLMVKYKK